MDTLECIGEFFSNNNRTQAAKKLAEHLKAEDLIIFIKDPELDVLLPGLGFSQSIPKGKEWRNFINFHNEEVIKGTLPYNNQEYPAVAVCCFQKSVAVLIGGAPEEIEVTQLKKILAIFSPLLIQEKLILIAESKANHSAKLAEKAERLTVTIDSIRANLTKVLEENSRLLKITKQQNEDLAAANEELLAANEEITLGLEELSNTNSQLLSINADLDNFIYTASHDLKSPILNIEGLVKMLSKNLLRNGWIDNSTKEIINMINLSVSRFNETISDLTEITKLGKESSIPYRLINLKEVIKDVMTDLHTSILESKAHISIDIDDQVNLLFSKKNLKSIIYNLLSNAIKYKKPNNELVVKFKWKEEVDFYILLVEDNGLGMDTNYKNKIFGLFKRMHSHVEGTGIGLYIVKKIIDNAGGKIEVESTVGVGTSFWVYFKK